MDVEQHARADLCIIGLAELENKGSFRVDVLRDMPEVLRGVFAFACLDKDLFAGKDKEEGWLDHGWVQFGAIVEEGTVFLLESEAVVLSAWSGFAVFFEGFWWVVVRLVRGNGKGGKS